MKPLAERLRVHLRVAGKPHHRGQWIGKLRRYGLRPRIQLVQTVPLGCWETAERYWIGYFRGAGCDLVNGTDGGQGTPGQRHTPEARAKMSAAKSKPRGPRGPMSAEQKAKLSAAAKRQMARPGAREAISRVHTGKTISDEHKAAISAGGRRYWQEQRER